MSVTAERLLSRRLIGRTSLMTLLGSWLTSEDEAPYRPLLLVGEAGIGKSRVRSELEQRAREAGVTVLSGRAEENGAHHPLQPLLVAFTTAAHVSGKASPASTSISVTTLGRLQSESGVADPDPLRVAEAVVAALAELGRQSPVVLTVDDIHCADPETLAVLSHLCDNGGAHGARLLFTSRPRGALHASVRRLIERRAVDYVELPPLTGPDLDELVLSCLDVHAAPMELLQFIRERSGGNPYAVEELLSGLLRSGALVRSGSDWSVVATRLSTVAPLTVAASIGQRLTGLTPRAREIVCTAALLGHHVDWQLLAPVLQADDESVLAGLREAMYAGLLGSHGEQIQFRHALTRDEVLATMLPPDRHRLAARALDVLHDDDPALAQVTPEVALGLAELSGRIDTWRSLLLETGLRAMRQGAAATAASRLRQAVELGGFPTDERQTGRADAQLDDVALRACEALAQLHALAGETEAAQQFGEAALRSLADSPDAATRRVHLRLALARSAMATEQLAVASSLAEGIRRSDDLEHHDDPALQQQLLALLAHLALVRGDLSEARHLARRVTDAPHSSAASRCEALEVLGRVARGEDVSVAERWFSAELECAESAGLSVWKARALHELGTIDLLDSMRLDRLERARRAAVETGVPATVALADFHLGEALVARGQTLAGRAAAERSIQLAERIGSPVLPWARLTVARSFAHERDDPAMRATIAAARQAAPRDPAFEAAVAGRVLAMRALHGADRSGARRELDRAVNIIRNVPGHHFAHWGLWSLVTTVEDQAAFPAAAAQVAQAVGSDTRFNRALLTAASAVAAGAAGEPAEAAQHWAAAEEELCGYERSEWLVHLTRWIAAESALEHSWGEAVKWAQDAVRWFSDHGYEPLATANRRFLRRVGAPVPRRGRGESQVPGELLMRGVTSREVDVLVLVSLRISNAEIADRLVLSPRTVEKHVASLMTKLDAAHRGELSAIADELGLLGS